MTTQQIAVFLEVAECLNFSEAAKHLFLSQPALSKQIAALEEEVGVSLFTRTTRTVKLTPSGQALRIELVKIEAALGTAIQRAQQEAHGTEGSLSICILDLLNPDLIILPAIEIFRARYPNVKLDLSFCGFSEIRNRLEAKEIDMAFNTFYEAVSTVDVNYLPLYCAPKQIYMSKHHPFVGREFLEFSDLKTEKFVIPEVLECPGELKWLTESGEYEGFFPKVARYVPNNLSRMLCIHANLGITIVDGHAPILPWMDIVTVPLKPQTTILSPEGSIVLTWRSKPSNPAFFSFREIIRDLVEDTAE